VKDTKYAWISCENRSCCDIKQYKVKYGKKYGGIWKKCGPIWVRYEAIWKDTEQYEKIRCTMGRMRTNLAKISSNMERYKRAIHERYVYKMKIYGAV
jgi:hypothetical protein